MFVNPALTSPQLCNSKNHKLSIKIMLSHKCNTLKCLSIGTLETTDFPFVPNGKLMVFRCPNILADYSLAVICQNYGTPKNN